MRLVKPSWSRLGPSVAAKRFVWTAALMVSWFGFEGSGPVWAQVISAPPVSSGGVITNSVPVDGVIASPVIESPSIIVAQPQPAAVAKRNPSRK